jgi:hypothetical protein
MRAPARCLCANIPQDQQEGRRNTASGLGSADDCLRTSARALETFTDDKHRVVALLLCALACGRISPVQARGGGYGGYLENPPSREQSWRKRNAPEFLPLVASGFTCPDGIMLKSGHERNDRNHQPKRTAA